ncbi:MAG: hypothetical protein NW201_05280 [Gemmatimonadales bacterium]|nr:hypothetical protein [Gemmatimonadales bacterium]
MWRASLLALAQVGAAGQLLALAGDPAPRVLPHAVPAGAPAQVIDLGTVTDHATLERRLSLLAPDAATARLTVPGGRAWAGDYALGSDQRIDGHLLVLDGTADLHGTVTGNVVAWRGDVLVHPGAAVTGDIVALGGRVRALGGTVGGATHERALAGASADAAAAPVALRIARSLAGVAGTFLALGLLGMALVMFGQKPLEVVSDTVAHSFTRAFAVGLLGQLLLLPTIGAVLAGLVLSVVGILLVPFVVIVFALLLVLGIVGGALATMHAMGETYTRRQLARGVLASPNSYRYLLAGVTVPLALWLVWALFGWAPVAGTLIAVAAGLFSWSLATAGFGAALLSRGGLRTDFAGRLLPPEMLTDEFLWATPAVGVPAVKRPTPRA